MSKSSFNIPDEGGIHLGQTLDVLRRKSHIIILSVISLMLLAGIKNELEPKIFFSAFELLTEPVTIETKVISRTNPESLSSNQDVVSVEVDEIKLRILKSRKIILPILEKLQDKYPKLTYDSLVQDIQLVINLQPNPSGNILTVNYSSNNAEQAKDVINLLSQAYLDYSLESRQTDIAQGMNFLDTQIPQLQERVNQLQKELELVRTKNNFIDPLEQAKIISNQINNFSEQLETTRVTLKDSQLKYSKLQAEKALALVNQEAGASIAENPSYQELKSQILALELEITQQSAILTENSSEMRIFLDKKQNLNNLLKTEIIRIYTELEADLAKEIQDLQIHEKTLNQTLEKLQLQINNLSTVITKYNSIQRELDIASTNYNQFITKREAFKIDAAQKQIPWQILTPPNEPGELPNSLKRSLALGGILGLLIGCGAAFITDKVSDKIYNAKELEFTTGLPILGKIPYIKNLRKAYLNQSNLSPYTSDMSKINEAFNSLFTSLYFTDKLNSRLNSFVISSAESGEGKTLITFYLGLTGATIGKRILIVDANLRSPYLHKQLNLNNSLGLTNLVDEADLELENVIQSSSLNPNLFILTSGNVLLEPMTILGSERMAMVMKKLAENFNMVIYDVSNILDLADAHLITSQTDGLLLVVGLGKLKSEILKATLTQLEISRTKVLGIVANQLTRN